MVLQDLGDSSSDTFSDSAYPSDNDPYSSSSSPSSGRYDATQLPQPLPVIGPFLGFSESVMRYRTEQTIKFAERRIGRAMTLEETNTLAYHLYKMEQTKSYFTALGTAYGTWRWYTTMATSRFPLYKPKPGDINPNKFMFVRGPAAQWARHSFRFVVWLFVAGELGKLTGQLVAQPLAARDTAADPKLSQFAADLKSAISQDQQKARDTGEMMRAEQMRIQGRNPDGSQLPPHAGAPRPWGYPRRSPAPAASPADDDMSPTAGNDPWSSASSTSFEDSASQASPQENMTGQRSPQQTQASEAWTGQPSSPGSGNEDASPTGGLFQDEVQSQPKLGESAWDRLRRRGGAVPGQRAPRRQEPPHREQKDSSALGDSFTFAESEDERRRAQERAQREFDQRIERERQGKDFNDERRW